MSVLTSEGGDQPGDSAKRVTPERAIVSEPLASGLRNHYFQSGFSSGATPSGIG
jgi:hypothetical protein